MAFQRLKRGIIAALFAGMPGIGLALAETVDFERQIKPILEEKCYRCHGEEKVKGELRLDSPVGIKAGGESGEILVPGDPNESPLYFLTIYPKDDPDYMPQKGEGLTQTEQALLKSWIEQGASFGDEPVMATEAKTKAKFGEADPATARNYMIRGDKVEIVEKIKETGALVDTVNHDASLFEVSFTYAQRPESGYDFEALSLLGDSLVKLSFARTEVSAVDLSRLERFSRLEYLDLGRTSLDDAALEHVARLKNLRYLNLRDTNVTDEGIQKLAGLKRLESLYLWGSQATAEGANRLAKKLPATVVNAGSRIQAPRRGAAGNGREGS